MVNAVQRVAAGFKGVRSDASMAMLEILGALLITSGLLKCVIINTAVTMTIARTLGLVANLVVGDNKHVPKHVTTESLEVQDVFHGNKLDTDRVTLNHAVSR